MDPVWVWCGSGVNLVWNECGPSADLVWIWFKFRCRADVYLVWKSCDYGYGAGVKRVGSGMDQVWI